MLLFLQYVFCALVCIIIYNTVCVTFNFFVNLKDNRDR